MPINIFDVLLTWQSEYRTQLCGAERLDAQAAGAVASGGTALDKPAAA
jgi:hypothetical protein